MSFLGKKKKKRKRKVDSKRVCFCRVKWRLPRYVFFASAISGATRLTFIIIIMYLLVVIR